MTKLRLKAIAKLFVVSIVILTGSPALAAQMARHDAHCRSCEQKAGAYRHQTFGPGVVRQSDARPVGTVAIQRTMIGRPG